MNKIEWLPMKAFDETVIAASPVIKQPATMAYRVVVRDLGDKFVVHDECIEEGRKPYFACGNYFPKSVRKLGGKYGRDDDSDMVALQKAWKVFEKRSRRLLGMPKD